MPGEGSWQVEKPNLMRCAIFFFIPEFCCFCGYERDEGGVIDPNGNSDDDCIDSIDFIE